MTQETKAKIQIKLEHAIVKLSKALPSILFWGGTTFLVGGVVKGYEADRKIRAHEKWTAEEAVPKFNNNAQCARDDRERINELEEKVNKLMEKSLEVTMGKESA